MVIFLLLVLNYILGWNISFLCLVICFFYEIIVWCTTLVFCYLISRFLFFGSKPLFYKYVSQPCNNEIFQACSMHNCMYLKTFSQPKNTSCKIGKGISNRKTACNKCANHSSTVNMAYILMQLLLQLVTSFMEVSPLGAIFGNDISARDFKGNSGYWIYSQEITFTFPSKISRRIKKASSIYCWMAMHTVFILSHKTRFSKNFANITVYFLTGFKAITSFG